MICPFYPDPVYFFFAEGVPDLLYYSHLTAIILSLLIGTFVYIKNTKSSAAKSLFLLTLFFAAWCLINLIAWTHNTTDTIIFIWSFYGLLYASIAASLFCFIYSYVNNDSLPNKIIYSIAILLLPILIFIPSNLNFTSINLTLCAVIDKGMPYSIYYYSLGFIFLFWIFQVLVKKYFNTTNNENRKQILLLGSGSALFIIFFFGTGIITDFLLIDTYVVEFYGLYAMTLFIGILAYLIVKFQAFNIKLAGVQALVITLWFLVGSLLFVAQSETTRIVSGFTLLITTVAGYYLVKSVKKEIKQREEIEILAANLANANNKLKELDRMKSEFVSIASHQLRSPLTSIRGYASMLAEGSYGKLPDKAGEILSKIAESAQFMAQSVEDYLNVSRIEAGNMKYEYSDFNLKDQASKVVDELRPVAMKKGLVLLFRSECSGTSMVHADIGKVRQVLMNLIDNAMKYTPSGTITVVAHDDVKKKKMSISIHDTGVGMDEQTLSEVFEKFVRAKNANSINVTGTGLGLYVAKKMVDQMNGKVWAESEGQSKGSIFHLEFTMISGKGGR